PGPPVRRLDGGSAGSRRPRRPFSRGRSRVIRDPSPRIAMDPFTERPRWEVTAPNESPVQMGKDSADELAALSLSRVEESLTRHGYAFVEDEEHPEILRARFDDYRFQFTTSGDEHGVLQTRGRWSHSVD